MKTYAATVTYMIDTNNVLEFANQLLVVAAGSPEEAHKKAYEYVRDTSPRNSSGFRTELLEVDVYRTPEFSKFYNAILDEIRDQHCKASILSSGTSNMPVIRKTLQWAYNAVQRILQDIHEGIR